jgi:hypothetical protein
MNKTGSGNKGLDWVIILGMIAAYPKTADVLSMFSPKILNDIFGFDMSLPYGLFCAAMVEGTILFLHFDRRAHRSGTAQGVKWILICVSFLCQVFDGYITTDSVAQMSPMLKLILTFAIPALPLIIAVMITAIGALPDADHPVAHVGLKNRLPDLKKVWYGDGNTEFSPSPSEVVQTELEEAQIAKPNGKKADTANPTKAGRQ